MALRRIGQILVDLGYISDEQLELLLEEQQQRPGQLLGQVAMDMGLIDDEKLAQALGEQMSLRTVALGDLTIAPEVLALVAEPMAQMYRIIPTECDEKTLTVAMCDPQNLAVQDELRTFLGYNIAVVVATEPAILAALDRYYGENTESVESIVSDLEDDEELAMAVAAAEGGSVDLTSVEALADSAPVRKLLNMVLLLAIKDHASDLHFEPFEDEFRIRIKADGVLYEMVPPPRHLAFAITTRIKVMADLDIAERRMPPGRADRVERRRSPGRLARERVAHHVWRECRHAGTRPLGRVARPAQRRHERRNDGDISRRDFQAERHRTGNRAHRFRKNHHALLGTERIEPH